MKITHALASLGLLASVCHFGGAAAHASGSGLTLQESYTLRMEATYFAHGGYNAYDGGVLTLHALHGRYILRYPVWSGPLSAEYRRLQRYILQSRLAFEMRFLEEETIASGGSCLDPYNDRPAICTASGIPEVDRTDLVLGSAL